MVSPYYPILYPSQRAVRQALAAMENYLRSAEFVFEARVFPQFADNFEIFALTRLLHYDTTTSCGIYHLPWCVHVYEAHCWASFTTVGESYVTPLSVRATRCPTSHGMHRTMRETN